MAGQIICLYVHVQCTKIMHVVLFKINTGRRCKPHENEVPAFVIDGLVLLVVHLVLSIDAKNS